MDKANPAPLCAPREGALVYGGSGENDLEHEEKGGDDDPVELVEEPQVGAAVSDEPPVRVEDEEGAEEEAEGEGEAVDVSGGVARPDEAATEHRAPLRPVGQGRTKMKTFRHRSF